MYFGNCEVSHKESDYTDINKTEQNINEITPLKMEDREEKYKVQRK